MEPSEYSKVVGLVSQDPTLYSEAVQMNWTICIKQDERTIDDDIMNACEEANIYEFITSLPCAVFVPYCAICLIYHC